MNSRWKLIAYLLVLLVAMPLVAGCEAFEEEEPEEEEPPPPSAQEIAGSFRQAYASLQQNYMHREARIPESQKNEALQQLQSARSQYAGTENAPEGMRRAAGEVEDLIRQANEQEAWSLVIFGVQALQVLDPGNERYERLAERAQLHLNRPEVEIRGFYTDQETQQTMAFMNVYLPEEDRQERVQVSPGEEFLGLRFDEIIGRNRGVRLEYLATNEIFEVTYRRSR